MPDLHDVLQREAERLQPDRVPRFADVIARESRRRKKNASLAAAACLAAIGLVAVSAIRAVGHDGRETLIPGADGTAAPAPAAPDVLVVECTAAGPALPRGDRVAVQRDGVHYVFRNTTESALSITYELGGDQVPAGATKDVVSTRLGPGTVTTVSCGVDARSLRDNGRRVTLDDPRGVYVPVPACSGRTAMRDFVAPQTGDPVGLTRKDHPRAEPVGYPDGSPRLVFTGDELIGWEGTGTAWTPTTVTGCSGPAPHVVARGIKAPPPIHLTRTDEFGVLTSLTTTTVVVDRAEMLTGPDAERAAAAAGQDGVPNDYFLRNDNPSTRAYPLSPRLVFWAGIHFGHQPGDEALLPLDRLRAFIATAAAKDTLFHLQIDDGVVVGIEEQYRP